jgi:O-antigen/teichoic acid export membrane protein
MSQNVAAITKGSVLARNTLISLLGQVLPVFAAIFSIPILINSLGTERFGALTLAWVVTGYFSLFDLGIGRALTKMVSEKLGDGHSHEVPALVWSAMFLVILMGLFGTFLLWIISPYLILEALKIPTELQTETVNTLYLLALSIPIVISSACLRGVLEAYQRFDLIHAVRIPAGSLTFIGPVLILPFSISLFYIVTGLVVIKIVECLVNLLLCLYVIPALRYEIVVRRVLLRPLIRFGSWMTISNIVGPLLVYSDRLFIGTMISLATVAYYTTPYEMVIKLMIIPGAFVGVLFPAFGASFVLDRNRSAMLYWRGLKYTFLSMFPIILIAVTLSHEVLELWLGGEFAEKSARILQWLAVGAFLSSLSYIPFAMVHASGRPDLTAKLHFIEAPFYLLALWWLIGAYGIEGAAIAWVGRAAFDTLLLLGMTQRLLLTNNSIIKQFLGSVIGAIFFLLIASNLEMGIALKGSFLFLTILIFVIIGWRVTLAPNERIFARNFFKKPQCF